MLDFQATDVVGVQVRLEIRLGRKVRGGGEFSCQPLGVTGQVAGTRRAGDAGGVKRVATRDERHACESESR